MRHTAGSAVWPVIRQYRGQCCVAAFTVAAPQRRCQRHARRLALAGHALSCVRALPLCCGPAAPSCMAARTSSRDAMSASSCSTLISHTRASVACAPCTPLLSSGRRRAHTPCLLGSRTSRLVMQHAAAVLCARAGRSSDGSAREQAPTRGTEPSGGCGRGLGGLAPGGRWRRARPRGERAFCREGDPSARAGGAAAPCGGGRGAPLAAARRRRRGRQGRRRRARGGAHTQRPRVDARAGASARSACGGWWPLGRRGGRRRAAQRRGRGGDAAGPGAAPGGRRRAGGRRKGR